MSIAASTAVWQRSQARGSARLVLLALADHAGPDGRAWPSAARLVKMTQLDVRNVQRALTRLVGAGEIIAVGTGRRGVVIYEIAVCSAPAPPAEAPQVEASEVRRKHRTAAAPYGAGVASAAAPVPEDPAAEPPHKPSSTVIKPSIGAAADAQAAVDEWNGLADRHGLVRVQRLTHGRAGKLTARLAEIGGIEGWRIALAKIAGTPGLRGHGYSGWRVSLDWLLIEQNLTRVMEGAYHGWKDPHAADRDIGIASHGYRRRSARGSYEDVLAGIAQAVAAIEADCGDHGG